MAGSIMTFSGLLLLIIGIILIIVGLIVQRNSGSKNWTSTALWLLIIGSILGIIGLILLFVGLYQVFKTQISEISTEPKIVVPKLEPIEETKSVSQFKQSCRDMTFQQLTDAIDSNDIYRKNCTDILNERYYTLMANIKKLEQMRRELGIS